MDIVSANYDLVKKVLDRYEKTGRQKVDIYLTHHKYVGGEGHGRCFKIKTDDIQVEQLEKYNLFKQLESPKPNRNRSTIFVYHGDFYLKEARDWYEKETSKENSSNSQHKWNPYLQSHKGELIMPDKTTMIFRGGNFGYLNELFNNFEHDVKTQQLKDVISKYLQGQRKNPNEINISKWKSDLKRKRPHFFKYFDIKFFPTDNHRLIYRNFS